MMQVFIKYIPEKAIYLGYIPGRILARNKVYGVQKKFSVQKHKYLVTCINIYIDSQIKHLNEITIK